MVTINPPSGDKSIPVRLISRIRRQGMSWALSQGQKEVKTTTAKPALKKSLSKSASSSPAKAAIPESSRAEAEPSPYLLVHIHGGGFIALSSETHDVSLIRSSLYEKIMVEIYFYYNEITVWVISCECLMH